MGLEAPHKDDCTQFAPEGWVAILDERVPAFVPVTRYMRTSWRHLNFRQRDDGTVLVRWLEAGRLREATLVHEVEAELWFGCTAALFADKRSAEVWSAHADRDPVFHAPPAAEPILLGPS